jgi:hypothetical protein
MRGLVAGSSMETDMRLGRDIREEVLLECDPGRTLLHATYYLWNQAGRFPLTAWVDAQEILRQARNECEQDRIEFVPRIEHASENALVAS